MGNKLGNYIYIFKVRTARSKAMNLAINEAQILLKDVGLDYLNSNPMSSLKATFAMAGNTDEDKLLKRLSKLGFTEEVYKCDFSSNKNDKNAYKWKNSLFSLQSFYKENKALLEEKAPNNREFILSDTNGNPRKIKGYRGDGTDLGRRALPVSDAKLLVNLVYKNEKLKFLDPFAGAGGIIIEAVANDWDVYSSDIDSILAFGLEGYGAKHFISRILSLPFQDSFFDVIATEVPFDKNATNEIMKGLGELKRVLKVNGKISMMTADYQAGDIRKN